MRNIYLMSAALVLMTMSANAQSMKRINKEVTAKTWVETATPQKAAKKIATRAGELEANQRYINYSYDESYVWPSGMKGAKGTLSLGTIFYNDAFKKYEGCKIAGARFFLTAPIGNSKVTICKIDDKGNVTNAIAEKEIATTQLHWNYVWFDEPYTIDTKDFYALLPFYNYTPEQVESEKPIGSSGTYVGPYGFLAFGDIYEDGRDETKWQWEPISAGYDGSNLMIQLIIEKEDGTFILHDLVMDKIAAVPFAKKGDKQVLAFTCHNEGRDNITNAKFALEMDGKRIGSFTYSKDNVAADQYKEITDADYTNIPVRLKVDDAWTTGDHKVTIYPVEIEGKAPEGELKNDTLTTNFKVYKENFDRTKNLVEFYACQMSKYTYFADQVLTKTAKAREDEDLAIVSIHGERQQVNEDGSVETLSDVFTVPEANKLANYSTPSDGSGAFNRYFYDNDVINYDKALTVNMAAQKASDQDNVVSMLNTIINESAAYYPSFSTVSIDSKLDDATGKKLSIKVMGKLINQYQKLIGDDARLTIYLTEDKVKGKQNTGGTMAKPTTHNHVLRKIVTGTLGDALQTNGNSYENDYEVKLDDAWKSQNMHIIAFVSRPMKETEKDGKTALASAMNDLWVDNTNMVAVGDSDLTGISNIINWNDVKEVGRYTIDGQKLNAPTKGINLVKLSNGQTIKVVVK